MNGIPQCQTLTDEDLRCPEQALYQVRGLPGYLWAGWHCQSHMESMRPMYNHQGGCEVVRLSDGERFRYLANQKAVGAPEGSPWGYLPCGCSHNGQGGHRT